jgi:hypothetical protein
MLPAPTASLATANSQRKETAECKDIKGLKNDNQRDNLSHSKMNTFSKF